MAALYASAHIIIIIVIMPFVHIIIYYIQVLQCMSPVVVVRVINGSINYGQSDDVDNKTEIQFPSWSLFTDWK